MAIEDDPVLSEAARPVDVDTEPEEREKSSGLRNAAEWVVIAGGALLVAFLIKTFLLQAFYIPSLSMAPTLQINDRVLVNKLSYDLHDVHRGDLVVFESPPNEGSETKDLIKRVIGLPGETVESRDGRILIDGQPLDEPYLDRGVTTGALEKITVPPDHLWVMGDNRANSRDSRFFGPIPESLVIGRAFVRVWPITDLRLF
jgi:signal peptidase I